MIASPMPVQRSEFRFGSSAATFSGSGESCDSPILLLLRVFCASSKARSCQSRPRG
jgi:hypothetical protein